jgi:hypothetical protein
VVPQEVATQVVVADPVELMEVTLLEALVLMEALSMVVVLVVEEMMRMVAMLDLEQQELFGVLVGLIQQQVSQIVEPTNQFLLHLEHLLFQQESPKFLLLLLLVVEVVEILLETMNQVRAALVVV